MRAAPLSRRIAELEANRKASASKGVSAEFQPSLTALIVTLQGLGVHLYDGLHAFADRLEQGQLSEEEQRQMQMVPPCPEHPTPLSFIRQLADLTDRI